MRPLKLSQKAFCIGLPGAMYCQATHGGGSARPAS